MTETEFRIKHSEIIEYYQLIEMRLKSQDFDRTTERNKCSAATTHR